MLTKIHTATEGKEIFPYTRSSAEHTKLEDPESAVFDLKKYICIIIEGILFTARGKEKF